MILQNGFKKSPDLVYLHMWTRTLSRAAESSHLRFPRLTTLSLFGDSEESVIEFIQRHPTIEEFRWFPLGVLHSFPLGFLPNCKRFQLSLPILAALEGNYLAAVQASSLEGSSTRDLRRPVELIRFRDRWVPNLLPYQFLDPLVGDFPNARRFEFRLDNRTSVCCDLGHRVTFFYHMDGWIRALSRFAHLDTIEGYSIWHLVRAGQITEQELIRRLAVACPKLRYLSNFEVEGGERLAIHPLSCGELGSGISSEDICYRVEKRKASLSLTRVFEPTSVQTIRWIPIICLLHNHGALFTFILLEVPRL
ncbi:hypothetical protein BDN72DRAFT_218597 [Pluteus cervinus]|uniref:Uncharacterized protein n=1 Tax=Pluteus cervinus TaxID=181527 RepID=A0ACD3AI39_9AGAR|nr:hypothetical protein BDN72DRAFT_218597 [Pluteus cervinus]